MVRSCPLREGGGQAFPFALHLRRSPWRLSGFQDRWLAGAAGPLQRPTTVRRPDLLTRHFMSSELPDESDQRRAQGRAVRGRPRSHCNMPPRSRVNQSMFLSTEPIPPISWPEMQRSPAAIRGLGLPGRCARCDVSVAIQQTRSDRGWRNLRPQCAVDRQAPHAAGPLLVRPAPVRPCLAPGRRIRSQAPKL